MVLCSNKALTAGSPFVARRFSWLSVLGESVAGWGSLQKAPGHVLDALVSSGFVAHMDTGESWTWASEVATLLALVS